MFFGGPNRRIDLPDVLFLAADALFYGPTRVSCRRRSGANSVKIKRVVYINQENRGEILLE